MELADALLVSISSLQCNWNQNMTDCGSVHIPEGSLDLGHYRCMEVASLHNMYMYIMTISHLCTCTCAYSTYIVHPLLPYLKYMYTCLHCLYT